MLRNAMMVRGRVGRMVLLLLGAALLPLSGCTPPPVPESAASSLPDGDQGALLRAAADGNIFRVDELLNAGVDPNARTADGATALMGSVYSGYPLTTRLLLERGADPNAATSDGVTALHYAAGRDEEEIARMLIAKGADVDARSTAGETPLAVARKENHEDVAQVLQTAGAKD